VKSHLSTANFDEYSEDQVSMFGIEAYEVECSNKNSMVQLQGKNMYK